MKMHLDFFVGIFMIYAACFSTVCNTSNIDDQNSITLLGGERSEKTSVQLQSKPCHNTQISNEIKPLPLNFTWYFLDKEEFLGLSISWMYSHPDQAGILSGFKIEIEERKRGTGLETTYVCVNSSLENQNITFLYNGYKRALPGNSYVASITTIPGNHVARRTLPVPSCKVLTPSAYTNACINIIITKPYDCNNRSFEIFYYVPRRLGSQKVIIRLCVKGLISCSGITLVDVFPVQHKLLLSGVTNITLLPGPLPNTTNEINLEVFPGGRQTRKRLNVTALLLSCTTTDEMNNEFLFSPPFLVLFSLILLLVFLTLGLCFKANWNVKRISAWLSCSTKDPSDMFNPNETTTDQQIKVYLLFVNDHKLHKEVVLKFASFLECDLNFKVILELYEQEEVYADPETWMEKSLSNADKVIIVWSPGAAKRWNMQRSIENDMFTPVLKQIQSNVINNDTSAGTFKCLSVYFDYCNESNIPPAFQSKPFSSMMLMEKFEDLYFQLSGMERLVNGNRLKDERVTFETYSHQNRHGEVLCSAIQEMRNFVKRNPDLYYQSDATTFTTSANVATNNYCDIVHSMNT